MFDDDDDDESVRSVHVREHNPQTVVALRLLVCETRKRFYAQQFQNLEILAYSTRIPLFGCVSAKKMPHHAFLSAYIDPPSHVHPNEDGLTVFWLLKRSLHFSRERRPFSDARASIWQAWSTDEAPWNTDATSKVGIADCTATNVFHAICCSSKTRSPYQIPLQSEAVTSVPPIQSRTRNNRQSGGDNRSTFVHPDHGMTNAVAARKRAVHMVSAAKTITRDQAMLSPTNEHVHVLPQMIVL